MTISRPNYLLKSVFQLPSNRILIWGSRFTECFLTFASVDFLFNWIYFRTKMRLKKNESHRENVIWYRWCKCDMIPEYTLQAIKETRCTRGVNKRCFLLPNQDHKHASNCKRGENCDRRGYINNCPNMSYAVPCSHSHTVGLECKHFGSDEGSVDHTTN